MSPLSTVGSAETPWNRSPTRKKLTWKLHREILFDNVLLWCFVQITRERGRDRRTVIASCVSLEARTTRPIQRYLSTPGRYARKRPPNVCHDTRTTVALGKGPKKPTFPTIWKVNLTSGSIHGILHHKRPHVLTVMVCHLSLYWHKSYAILLILPFLCPKSHPDGGGPVKANTGTKIAKMRHLCTGGTEIELDRNLYVQT